MYRFLDQAYTSTERLVAPLLTVAKKYGATIASAKTGLLRNKTGLANAAKMPPEAWYEMYVNPWWQELAMVGMCVLSQIISSSAYERNWSAHGHHGTSSRRCATGLVLEPLKGLSAFTQTPKWQHKFAIADELKMFA